MLYTYSQTCIAEFHEEFNKSNLKSKLVAQTYDNRETFLPLLIDTNVMMSPKKHFNVVII